MEYVIKELRGMTGMTQKEFADMYGIPLSTLRKWEQGEAAPASYVVKLIAKTLPGTASSLKKIQVSDDVVYYYDKNKQTIADARGNEISIQENLEDVKEQNLALYLQDLFESFYEIQEKFNRDCRFDKEEDILWTR